MIAADMIGERSWILFESERTADITSIGVHHASQQESEKFTCSLHSMKYQIAVVPPEYPVIQTLKQDPWTTPFYTILREDKRKIYTNRSGRRPLTIV